MIHFIYFFFLFDLEWDRRELIFTKILLASQQGVLVRCALILNACRWHKYFLLLLFLFFSCFLFFRSSTSFPSSSFSPSSPFSRSFPSHWSSSTICSLLCLGGIWMCLPIFFWSISSFVIDFGIKVLIRFLRFRRSSFFIILVLIHSLPFVQSFQKIYFCLFLFISFWLLADCSLEIHISCQVSQLMTVTHAIGTRNSCLIDSDGVCSQKWSMVRWAARCSCQSIP